MEWWWLFRALCSSVGHWREPFPPQCLYQVFTLTPWPRRSTNLLLCYVTYVMLCQIDILPGQGGGATPLTNSVELEPARRTPDTSDGLHFTDLFTVSQSRQQSVANNIQFSSEQQQQPTVNSSNLFLARWLDAVKAISQAQPLWDRPLTFVTHPAFTLRNNTVGLFATFYHGVFPTRTNIPPTG